MLNLENLFLNFFRDAYITDLRLDKFAHALLASLRSNNPDGKYDAEIATLETVLAIFSTALAAEDVSFSQQQSHTVNVDDIIKSFKTEIQKCEGLISGNFGKKSPEYEEAFPLGLKEYSHVTKTTIENLLNRMVTFLNTHKSTLGEPVYTRFAGLQSGYQLAREEQLEKKGATSSSRSASSAQRIPLETEMQKIILKIATDHVNDPIGGMAYFDQRIIRRPHHREGATGFGSFKGTIIDSVTKAPLANVMVQFVDTDYADVTDIKGEFSFDEVASGEYNLKVSLAGYQDYESKVVIGNTTTTLDVALVMNPAGV